LGQRYPRLVAARRPQPQTNPLPPRHGRPAVPRNRPVPRRHQRRTHPAADLAATAPPGESIYLLVDKDTSQQYIGSAKGEDSLWGRLSEYARTGHGGNIELKNHPEARYQASILQFVDQQLPDHRIEQIESWWKDKLMTISSICTTCLARDCAGWVPGRQFWRVEVDHRANSRAARAAAHGAHNGTSTSPSKSELYWPEITASKFSQMPRSAG